VRWLNHDYFKKIIPAGLLFSGLILITAQSYADCSVNSSVMSIGKVPSITLAEKMEFNLRNSVQVYPVVDLVWLF
jgi:energy-converting hydrogenase Eha subunit C